MMCPDCFTDISTYKGYARLIDSAGRARSFLESHPATGGSIFDLHSHLWYSAQGVCKRGMCESAKESVAIYYTPENYKRYPKQFEEAFKEEGKKEFARIEIPYKDHFGEPWIFDHVAYWTEMGFVIYKGKDYKNYFKQDNWEKFAGITANGRCFEEAVINTAQKFKKAFGDFSGEDFLTVGEKKNHEKHFILKSTTLKGRFKGFTGLIPNKKYIHITSAEISHRWAKWYAKTPHGQKYWKESLDEILKGL